MRHQLYVHIGLHKTGTTSIQHCLSNSPYQLHDLGVLYPTSARHPYAQDEHVLLAKAFDDSSPLEGAFALRGPVDGPLVVAALRHEIELSGLETIVVSSEEMSRYSTAEVERLAAAFSDFDIHPVAFVRNFPDLFDALYATIIEHTAHTALPDEGMYVTDIVDRFRAWASIAADGTIHVLDYDHEAGRDSVRSFLAVLGIDAEQLDPATRDVRLNRSPSPAHTVIVRELRRQGIEPHQVTGLIAQLQGVPIEERQTCLPATLRARLATAYAEQVAALRAASWVTGLAAQPGDGDEPPDPIYMGTLTDVLLAIGRGLGRTHDRSA